MFLFPYIEFSTFKRSLPEWANLGFEEYFMYKLRSFNLYTVKLNTELFLSLGLDLLTKTKYKNVPSKARLTTTQVHCDRVCPSLRRLYVKIFNYYTNEFGHRWIVLTSKSRLSADFLKLTGRIFIRGFGFVTDSRSCRWEIRSWIVTVT